MFQFVCTRCGKKCKNAGGLATHKDPHEAEGLWFSFSFAIREESPGKENPDWTQAYKERSQQIKLRPKLNLKPLRPMTKPKVIVPLILSEHIPPPPLRCARSSCLSISDLKHYIAPQSIISSSLDEWSPEIRVAHVRDFQKLKQESFHMLDKTASHTADTSSLGVRKYCQKSRV